MKTLKAIAVCLVIWCIVGYILESVDAFVEAVRMIKGVMG